MNNLLETIEYFLFITVELIVLFMAISAIVELIFMHIPEETVRKKLSGKGLWGNVLGGLFGALTPFCACSTIPMTVGLLNAKVPFGSVMSFLIASPLLNPIIIGMLATLISFKAAVLYFVVAFACSVFFGYLMQKMGGRRFIKEGGGIKQESCCVPTEERKSLPWKNKIALALDSAWNSLRPIMGYLLIGVALGSVIYGYLPEEYVLRVAGPDNLLAVPVAAVLGIPLYIRAETAIPIGVALMGKGMSIGAVVALVIGGAGMAIPEMTMLASLFKKRMVIMMVLTIFLTATIGGYLFNLFL